MSELSMSFRKVRKKLPAEYVRRRRERASDSAELHGNEDTSPDRAQRRGGQREGALEPGSTADDHFNATEATPTRTQAEEDPEGRTGHRRHPTKLLNAAAAMRTVRRLDASRQISGARDRPHVTRRIEGSRLQPELVEELLAKRVAEGGAGAEVLDLRGRAVSAADAAVVAEGVLRARAAADVSGRRHPLRTVVFRELVHDVHVLWDGDGSGAASAGTIDLSRGASGYAVAVAPADVAFVCRMLHDARAVGTLNFSRIGAGREAADAIVELLAANGSITRLLIDGNPMPRSTPARLLQAASSAVSTGRRKRDLPLSVRFDDVDVPFGVTLEELPFGHLDLTEARVCVGDLDFLLPQLSTTTSLTALSMVNVSARATVKKIADSLPYLLSNDSGLEYLNLSGTSVGDAAASRAVHSLGTNHTLTALDAAACNLGPKTARALALALERNQGLTSLSLAKNSIGSRGCDNLSNALLAHNRVLSVLDLSHCGLRTAAAGKLGNMLQKRAVMVSLAIGGNSISLGAVPWSTVLRSNNSLQTLILERVRLPVQLLRASLNSTAFPSIAAGSFSAKAEGQLDLAGMGLQDRDMEFLGAMLPMATTLTALNLSGNASNVISVTSICSALRYHSHIHQFAMMDAGIDAQGAAAIASLIRCNTTCKELWLSGNRFSDEARVGALLADAVIANAFSALEIIQLDEWVIPVPVVRGTNVQKKATHAHTRSLVTNIAEWEKTKFNSTAGIDTSLDINIERGKLSRCDVGFLSHLLPVNRALRHLNLAGQLDDELDLIAGLAANLLVKNTVLETITLGSQSLEVQHLLGLSGRTVHKLEGMEFTWPEVFFIGEMLAINTTTRVVSFYRSPMPHPWIHYLSKKLAANWNNELLRFDDVEIPQHKLLWTQEVDLSGKRLQVSDAIVISEVVRNSRDLQVLDLSWNPSLDDEAANHLGDMLTENTSLTTLRLSGCGLTTAGALTLSSCLKENRWLTSLYLDEYDIAVQALRKFKHPAMVRLQMRGVRITARESTVIASMLHAHRDLHPELRWINMVNCELTADAVRPLATLVQLSTSISHLNLWRNSIGDEGATAIADALMANPACPLTSLTLARNDISDVGLGALGSMLASSTVLETLSINENPAISLDGLASLADTLLQGKGMLTTLTCDKVQLNVPEALGLTRREHFIYPNERFAQRDAAFLGAALRKYPRIKSFVMADNDLDDVSVERLSQLLTNNLNQLSSISFRNNPRIGDWGMETVCRRLASNLTIEDADLQDTSMGDFAAVAIGESMKQNTTLKSLDLRHNTDIRSMGAASIGAGLKANHHLVKLDMRGCRVAGGAKLLAKGLRLNTTLTSLDISDNDFSVEEGDAIGAAFSGLERSVLSVQVAVDDDLIVVDEFLRTKHVSLDGMALGGVSVALILRLLHAQPTCTSLKFGSVFCGSELVPYVTSLLAANKMLTAFDARSMHKAIGHAVHLGLSDNRTLKSLRLDWTLVDEETCTEMEEMLNANRHFVAEWGPGGVLIRGVRHYPNGDVMEVEAGGLDGFIALGSYRMKETDDAAAVWIPTFAAGCVLLTWIASVIELTLASQWLWLVLLGVAALPGPLVGFALLRRRRRMDLALFHLVNLATVIEGMTLTGTGVYESVAADIRSERPFVGLEPTRVLTLLTALLQAFPVALVSAAYCFTMPPTALLSANFAVCCVSVGVAFAAADRHQVREHARYVSRVVMRLPIQSSEYRSLLFYRVVESFARVSSLALLVAVNPFLALAVASVVVIVTFFLLVGGAPQIASFTTAHASLVLRCVAVACCAHPGVYKARPMWFKQFPRIKRTDLFRSRFYEEALMLILSVAWSAAEGRLFIGRVDPGHTGDASIAVGTFVLFSWYFFSTYKYILKRADDWDVFKRGHAFTVEFDASEVFGGLSLEERMANAATGTVDAEGADDGSGSAPRESRARSRDGSDDSVHSGPEVGRSAATVAVDVQPQQSASAEGAARTVPSLPTQRPGQSLKSDYLARYHKSRRGLGRQVHPSPHLELPPPVFPPTAFRPRASMGSSSTSSSSSSDSSDSALKPDRTSKEARYLAQGHSVALDDGADEQKN